MQEQAQNELKKKHVHKYAEEKARILPTVGLGVVLIFKISGRGIMDPDVPLPLATLTLLPSSKYLIPTLQGFLQADEDRWSPLSWYNKKQAKGILSHPVTGSTT